MELCHVRQRMERDGPAGQALPRAAYRRVAKIARRARVQLLGRHLMQRRALYARAIKDRGLRTALQIFRDEAALERRTRRESGRDDERSYRCRLFGLPRTSKANAAVSAAPAESGNNGPRQIPCCLRR